MRSGKWRSSAVVRGVATGARAAIHRWSPATLSGDVRASRLAVMGGTAMPAESVRPVAVRAALVTRWAASAWRTAALRAAVMRLFP